METNKDNKEETKQEEKPSIVLKQSEFETLVNKAKAHIASVKEQVLKYTGKINHNPYLWLKTRGFTKAEEMIANIETYKQSDVVATLTALLSIKAEAPLVINPPIMDRKELNDKIEKEKEAKKKL